jgi:tRNA/rRNA methyltransferase
MQDGASAEGAGFDARFVARAAQVRFVLVAPSHPGNIGASARAVRTMGFAQLSVVAPRVADFAVDAEAIALATHGVNVLTAARSEPTLTRALHGVHRAFAMTGYAREFAAPPLDLRAAAALARDAISAGQTVAFVFGTERSGLLNEDVERCTDCCSIPADPVSGSLNLAQAVQVTAYETRLALCADAPAAAPLFETEPPAPVDAVEAMLDHLERALAALGYLDPSAPKRLGARLRRLFGRARPTASEIDILRGIAAAIIERKSDRAGSKHARGG